MAKKSAPKQEELDAQLFAMMASVGAVQEEEAPAPAPAAQPAPKPGPSGKSSGWGPRSK